MKSLTHIKTGIGCVLSLLFVNATFADATSDARIQAYKSNKLIPENIVLPTSTNGTDSQEVVAFSVGNLKWDSGTASQLVMNALVAKYGSMTLAEIKDSMGPAGTWDDDMWDWAEHGWLEEVTPEVQEIREYLSAVANGRIESDSLSSSEALSYLQAQFDAIVPHNYTAVGAFPCEGLDFSNSHLSFCNLTECTGITVEQILSAGSIQGVVLPSLTFSGSEDFSGKAFYYTDFSNCIGITGEQIVSTSKLYYTGISAIAFNGTEDFSGKSFSGIDFSKCTGITANQIGSAKSISNIHITSTQYNDWKSTLQSKFNGKFIFIDGMRTKIQ